MLAAHIEYDDDHTEREPLILPIGFTDPHEQTGSDAETLPLGDEEGPEPEIEIAKRWHRWRMYFDPEHGTWEARQPHQIDVPMFRRHIQSSRLGAVSVFTYGSSFRSGAQVLEDLQLAIAKAEATL